jgi:hypothetical protein
MTCHQQIRISKIDGAGPDAKKRWNKFEMDGVTPHVCSNKKQQKDQQQQPTLLIQHEPPAAAISDLADEIADLRAYIKTLVTQVQLLRKECGQAFGVVQKQD